MLPQYLVREAVQRALAEDIGRGDITTDALIDGGAQASARLMAREQGIVAGLDLAEAAFRGVEPSITFDRLIADGQPVKAGDVIARISGSARALLSAERVALNFMTHMSGIASLTGRYVAAIGGTHARIVDTRKTLPGLRVFEKYAVRMGGGANHRFALDDAAIGHMVKICCEVDRIDQIEEALSAGVDVLLLDNMGPDALAEAVRLIAGRATAEASGKVSLETVGAIAASGVDVISVGKLTHSAPALDIALDFDG